MPAATSLNTKQRLINVIKRFKFEELEIAVIPIFPEITWNDVRSKLVNDHESFTVKNAIKVIEDAIVDARLQEKDLNDRLSTLEVIDISRHHKRKVWHAYALKDANSSSSHFTDKQIQDDIKKQFLSINMTTDVKVITYDTMKFICIKEKSKKRQIQYVMPTFFALFLEQKYIFSSKRSVSKIFLTTITNCIGYSNVKQIKLMGRDLKSLIKLLWIKKQGALATDSISNPPVYRNAYPMIKTTGLDYTQGAQRRKYAEKCFGQNPPKFELLIINGPTVPWKAKDVSSKIPDKTVHIGWEFRSNNIATFLTKLTEQRALVSPLPYYASNLMLFGKTELTIEERQLT